MVRPAGRHGPRGGERTGGRVVEFRRPQIAGAVGQVRAAHDQDPAVIQESGGVAPAGISQRSGGGEFAR